MNAIRIKFSLITIWVFVLASCSHNVVRPSTDSYHLIVTDNAMERRFDVFVKSDDNRPLCIAKEDWPNTSGFFTVERDGVFVESTSGVFPARSPLISAYCPGGCGLHRIEPYGELRGFIEYEAFDDSVHFASDMNKKLRFLVSPRYCSK